MRKSIILSFFVTAFAQVSYAEQVPNSSFDFGNWSGAAYTIDETGEFSHCAIAADYLSGDTLLFSVNADATVSVGISNDNFNMKPGQTFPVTIEVDRRRPFFGTAEAVSSTLAVLTIPDFERALTSFKRGYGMTIQGESFVANYDLTGTYGALERATRCAVDNYNYVNRSPGQNTESENLSSYSRDETNLLYKISTQLVSQAGVDDYSFLDENEIAELGMPDGVLWRAENGKVIGGSVLIGVEASDQLRDSDGPDITFLTGRCDGDHATSARDLGDAQFEIREIRMLCSKDGNTDQYFLSKMDLDQERHLYTILFFFGDDQVLDKPTAEINKNAAIQTASFLR